MQLTRRKNNLPPLKAAKKVKDAIPKAWQVLLNETDSGLRSMLADTVEKICGTKPDVDDLDMFLKNALLPTAQPTRTPTKAKMKTDVPTTSSDDKKKRIRIVGYVFNNKTHEIRVNYQTLAAIIKEFHLLDAEFMPRLAAATVEHSRRLVAQNREDLFKQKKSPDYSIDLGNGWWMGKRPNHDVIRKNCQIACDIASVKFGSQLTLIER